MSDITCHPPRYNPNRSFFTEQRDGSLRCPTCAKERVDCLVWNPNDGVFDYRLRPPGRNERFATTTHAEIGPVRIVAGWAIHHGVPFEVLAQPIVCAAGLMVITDWTSTSIRSYGASIPGRMGASRRDQDGTSQRKAPVPLKYLTWRVYDWVLRFLVPTPKDAEEFVRLMVICSHLVGENRDYWAPLREYADELLEYFDQQPPAAEA